MTENEINRITHTLGEGHRNYYVYALCVENVPFYIGKGRNVRILNHQDVAEIARESIYSDKDLSEQEKQEKINKLSDKLQKLIQDKENIQPVIIKWGLSEKEAFMCESSLINLLNFAKLKESEKLTNIMNGHASEAESDSVADVKTKARTLNQFLNECAIQERDISEIKETEKDKIVCIKINKLYPECIDENDSIDNDKLKDCVRGNWNIHKDKLKKLKYIFALYNGRVVGVFHITEKFENFANASLEKFPTFPEDTRKKDHWVYKFATIEDAKKNLSIEEYDEFILFLDNKNKYENKNSRLKDFRERVFFCIEDNNIPEELLQYKNCIIKKEGEPKCFRGQNPIRYIY